MRRVSGFLLPLLLALLVIPAVAAIDYESVNGMDIPKLETKTITEEEVAAEQHGEILAVYAVESKPSQSAGTPELLTTAIYYGPITGNREIIEGGIRASPGGL